MSTTAIVSVIVSASCLGIGYLASSSSQHSSDKAHLVQHSQLKPIGTIADESKRAEQSFSSPLSTYGYTFAFDEDRVMSEYAPTKVILSRSIETILTDEPVEVPGPTYNARGRKVKDTHTEYKRREEEGRPIIRGLNLKIMDDEMFNRISPHSINDRSFNSTSASSAVSDFSPPRNAKFDYLSVEPSEVPSELWIENGVDTKTNASVNVNVNINSSDVAKSVMVGVRKQESIVPSRRSVFVWGQFYYDHQQVLRVRPYVDPVTHDSFDTILSYKTHEQVVTDLKSSVRFMNAVAWCFNSIGAGAGVYGALDILSSLQSTRK